ncbi:MAG TPA: DUF362 domain-containing protein [Pirellulaceae bacterium]|jgi:uncharacterized protein (DUF362 family)|nr:DUF362 domain-containing protein [Pirellulaceae bacterium]
MTQHTPHDKVDVNLPSNCPKRTTCGLEENARVRRAMLVGGSLAAAGVIGYPLIKRVSRHRELVFIARHQRYDGSLVQTIRDGLLASGMSANDLVGKRVVLKPNLVEPTRAVPHMTTHPTMILATAEVFRGFGAHVIVGEAPGHVRDTEMALVESGLQEALDSIGLEFSDLNYEEVKWVKNGGRASRLGGFHFPQSIVEADLIVSMPKMKTHHWVGVTAAMKNLYGTLPGIKYGWPKNVLHQAGIPETVFDINASLPKVITVVDGIQCMEGDGPIMGSPKQMGLVLVGTNAAAVDATVCRLMRLNPARVGYLQLAADRLGPIDSQLIDQTGEHWEPLAQTFEILDKPHLQPLRDGVLMS